MRRGGERQTQMSYSHTRRSFDNLTWDNDPPSAELYEMSYNQQTELDRSITFLGAKI